MTKPQGFLATFRIDEELWGKFKDIAKNKQTSASALIIQYIQGVVSSGGVDDSPKATPPNIDNAPGLSIQDMEKIVDDKIKQSIQINTPSIQNIEDLIDSRIASACQSGAVKDAIANSYAAIMGNFNGLLSEVRELQSNPPAPVPNDQLSMTNYELPTTNDQLSMTNDQLPSLNKNQIENIRTTLKRKGIQSVSNDQIRNAFKDAGWDGSNYQETRKAVIDLLSKVPK